MTNSFKPSQGAGGTADGLSPHTRWLMFGLVMIGAAMFLARLTGPAQLTGNEWRVSAYVLDVLQNGHWACQTDTSGDVASKPPMLTWLVTLGTFITGGTSRFAFYWPTAAATILTALVLFKAGGRYLGMRAGLFSAVMYLVSGVGVNQMAMPRYDGLLALPVLLGAVAAYEAWQTGRGWTWFWLWVTLGTLVKGPLALLLAGFGLLAIFWMKKSGESQPLRGRQWPGLILFLAVTAGWFAWAYADLGSLLTDKMLRRELVGHAMGNNEKNVPLAGFYEPTVAFMVFFAPWSLFTLLALWRVIKRPSASTTDRSFERFLFCSFVAGLLLFSVAAHQRGRLIFPLVPFAALLAGRELARLTTPWNAKKILRCSGGLALAMVLGVALYSHVFALKDPRVNETAAIHALTDRIHGLGNGQFPLVHVSGPNSLQVLLKTRIKRVSAQEAAGLLDGETPAFVVVEDKMDNIRSAMKGTNPIHELYRWPETGRATIRIISNHPRLEWPRRAAFYFDGLKVEMDGAHFAQSRGDDLYFVTEASGGSVRVSNPQSISRRIVVHCNVSGKEVAAEEKLLAPGEVLEKQWQQSSAQASPPNRVLPQGL